MTATNPGPAAPMRRHVRRPTDVPIGIRLGDVVPRDREYLRNIGRGGLCFLSLVPIAAGRTVRIEIPLMAPVFEADGEVAWCRETSEGFEVGVRFAALDSDAARLLFDRVCEIERYKLDVWIRDGRSITGEQAAVEWLMAQAAEGPRAEGRGPGA